MRGLTVVVESSERGEMGSVMMVGGRETKASKRAFGRWRSGAALCARPHLVPHR